jgi:hypothetical protein
VRRAYLPSKTGSQVNSWFAIIAVAMGTTIATRSRTGYGLFAMLGEAAWRARAERPDGWIMSCESVRIFLSLYERTGATWREPRRSFDGVVTALPPLKRDRPTIEPIKRKSTISLKFSSRRMVIEVGLVAQ